MVEAENLYELLKRKDAELAAYRDLVESLRSHISQAASEHESSEAWARASVDLDRVFYEHGFKSDGSWRGE